MERIKSSLLYRIPFNICIWSFFVLVVKYLFFSFMPTTTFYDVWEFKVYTWYVSESYTWFIDSYVSSDYKMTLYEELEKLGYWDRYLHREVVTSIRDIVVRKRDLWEYVLSIEYPPIDESWDYVRHFFFEIHLPFWVKRKTESYQSNIFTIKDK